MSKPLRLGLRREVLLLVPVSLLLVVVLSTFTLFAYRNALNLLAQERRMEVERQAESTAVELSRRISVTEDDLRRLARGATSAALLDADGEPLLTVGEAPAEGPMALLLAKGATPPATFGPGGGARDRVVAFARLADGRLLRIDQSAGLLASQLRTVRFLFGIVLAADLGALFLLILFLRRLLTPYEAMLDRARQLDREGGLGATPPETEAAGDPDDEMAFLLSTFDRALRQLSSKESATPPDESAELASLGRTLGPSFESGLLLLDRQGAVLALNAVGADLLGVALPPSPQTPFSELLGERGELTALLAEAVATGQGVKRRECRLGEQALGLTVHALRPTGREVRGFLALFADLTQARRDAEESRLAESLAHLGELTAGVAHELRNSLGTLRGYLGLLERQPRVEPAAEESAEYLSEMRRETDHLQRVLEDFLAFARPGTIRPQPVDLVALARRCAADPALEGAAVELEVASGAQDEAILHGDPQLLERALRNLVRNAVEAEERAGRPGGARIEILTRGEESEGAAEIELRIEDRGEGVSEEMVDRLFLPFATGRSDGVGLGLALSHRIVTLHGGSIRYERREGGGSRFCLLFPAGRVVTDGSDGLSSSS